MRAAIGIIQLSADSKHGRFVSNGKVLEKFDVPLMSGDRWRRHADSTKGW